MGLAVHGQIAGHHAGLAVLGLKAGRDEAGGRVGFDLEEVGRGQVADETVLIGSGPQPADQVEGDVDGRIGRGLQVQFQRAVIVGELEALGGIALVIPTGFDERVGLVEFEGHRLGARGAGGSENKGGCGKQQAGHSDLRVRKTVAPQIGDLIGMSTGRSGN